MQGIVLLGMVELCECCDNLIPSESCKFCILDVFSSHQINVGSVGGASVLSNLSALIYAGYIYQINCCLTCI